jgi:hypothetical protein
MAGNKNFLRGALTTRSIIDALKKRNHAPLASGPARDGISETAYDTAALELCQRDGLHQALKALCLSNKEGGVSASGKSPLDSLTESI